MKQKKRVIIEFEVCYLCQTPTWLHSCGVCGRMVCGACDAKSSNIYTKYYINRCQHCDNVGVQFKQQIATIDEEEKTTTSDLNCQIDKLEDKAEQFEDQLEEECSKNQSKREEIFKQWAKLSLATPYKQKEES